MNKKEIKTHLIEEGKTYKTMFQTGEMVTIGRIDKDKNGEIKKLWVVYDKSPHLGLCPLNADRIDPETGFIKL